MAFEVLVPRLGWDMEQGQFVRWLKNDGDPIEVGDFLFILETDKAAQEVESFDRGVLRIAPGGPQPGDTVSVGVLLGYIVGPNEPDPFAEGAASAASTAAAAPAPAAAASPRGNGSGDVSVQTAAPTQRRDRRRGPAVSPRAKRVAGELGVDWKSLTGSGRTGRIVERDVRAAASRAPAAGAGGAGIPGRLVPLSPTRIRTAERLTAGAAIPTVTLSTEVDATQLVAQRTRLKAAAANEPTPTYNDLIIQITAGVLRQHPLLNASWQNEALFIPDCVNMGIAVDVDDGLVVPVIRDADKKDIAAIAGEARELIDKARGGRLRVDDLQGGTFTISNLGMHAIDAFTPLLNPPQSAILGVGRIVRKPSVVGDQVVPQERLTLSLTFDHRVVDGAPAARFLEAVGAGIETA